MINRPNYVTAGHQYDHLFVGFTYSLSGGTNNKLCVHIDGGQPFRCSKQLVVGTDCELRCDKYKRCIAYSRLNNQCQLIQSSGPCPYGWTKRPGKYATSLYKLRGVARPGHVCKVKPGLAIIIILTHTLFNTRKPSI